MNLQKAFIGVVWAVAFCECALAQEVITLSNKLATFTNLQGQVYRAVELVRADTNGIIFRYTDAFGGGRLSYTNLSQALLDSLGIPTNWVVTAKAIAERKPVALPERKPVALPVGERVASYNSVRSHIGYILTLRESDLPQEDKVQTVYREITSELKGIGKALELGISYAKFSDLLREKALAVERIKDLRGEGLQRRFLSEADECVKAYTASKEDWKKSIDESYSERIREGYDYFMRENWAQADIHLLYCAAIAEKNTNASIRVMYQVASMIKAEQDAVRDGVLTSSRDPAVYGLSIEEIRSRLKAVLEPTDSTAHQEFEK